MVISLPRQSEQVLFAGIFGQPTAGVDVESSILQFEQRWVDRVEQAFPGALVSFGEGPNIVVSGDEEQGTSVYMVVQDIGESLFEDGEAWMAGTDEACTSCGEPISGADPDVSENLCSACEVK